MARRANRGDGHHRFEHAADERRGEPIVAVPPLLLKGKQPRVGELGEMAAGRLRRYSSDIGQFGRGLGAPILEHGEDVGTRRVAEQRGDGGEVDGVAHVKDIGVITLRIERQRFGPGRSVMGVALTLR